MRFRLAAYIMSILAVTMVMCPCRAAGNQALSISPDQQLAYAEHLYKNGQFRRAAEEYQRFAFFFESDPRRREVLFKAGQAFFQAQAYQTALGVFDDLTRADLLDDPGIKAYFMSVECYFALGRPGQALLHLHNLIQMSDSRDIQDRARFRMGWIYLEQRDWQAAKEAFSSISQGSRYSVRALLHDLRQVEQIPRKSPALAGSLSIVPGAGQLYCGRPKDALAAFLVNVGLIWAAVDAFDDEHYALGGLLSFVGAGFYAGNIYSAVSSAHKYNQDQDRLFINGIRRRFAVGLVPAPGSSSKGFCLALTFRF